MKKVIILFCALIMMISTTSIGIASVYAKADANEETELLVVKDIEILRSKFDLSNTADKREFFKELLICAGTSEDFAEKAAQFAPEDIVDGIANAEQIGGASKTF